MLSTYIISYTWVGNPHPQQSQHCDANTTNSAQIKIKAFDEKWAEREAIAQLRQDIDLHIWSIQKEEK